MTLPQLANTIFLPDDRPSETDTASAAVVVGLKFRVASPCVITAFRYWKADSENGWHTGYIYNSMNGFPVATTGVFDDTDCEGGSWVTVPLQRPFRPQVDREYIVTVDYVLYFAQSQDYFPTRAGGDARPILPIAGVRGADAGYMPLDDGNSTVNYWLDGT